MNTYNRDSLWDHESQTWHTTCKELPGLQLCTETVAEAESEALEWIPHLIEHMQTSTPAVPVVLKPLIMTMQIAG